MKKSITKIVEFIFGIFFIGIAITILFITELYWGSILVSLVVGILGIDLIISAFNNKISLLSKIGSIP